MASVQGGNGGHVKAVFVPFNQNGKLPASFHDAIVARRKEVLETREDTEITEAS